MDNPVIEGPLPKSGASASTSRSYQSVQPVTNSVALKRTWLALNLLGIAALGSLHTTAEHFQLFVGWAVFTALNSLLSGSARLHNVISTQHKADFPWQLALNVTMGIAWGSGALLLLPHASTTEAGIMLLLIALITVAAIPCLTATEERFAAFMLPCATIVIAAVVLDGRFVHLTAWFVLFSCALLVMAHVFNDERRQLLLFVQSVFDQIDGNRQASTAALKTMTPAARLKLSTLKDLRGRYERKRRVLRTLGDAVVTTTQSGEIDYLNPVAEVMLGSTLKQLRKAPVEQGLKLVSNPEQQALTRDMFNQMQANGRTFRSDGDTQLVRRDGVIYGVDVTATPIKDEFGEFAGTSFLIRDVTEQRHQAESVAWQASHDPLTGAINRTEFEIRMRNLIRNMHNDNHKQHALLYLDIDKFKFINDSYGHAAGDIVLKTLAEVLRTRIRGADTLARIGGDEFCCLLYSCSADKARLIAEGLRIAVERAEFQFEQIELPVSLSIGIAEIDSDSQSTAEVIRAADAACYSAKQYGRNRVQIFEPDAGGVQKQSRVFDFVKDIQTAIHGNRLELFYEPLQATQDHGDAMWCELSVGVRNAEGEIVPREDLAKLARRYQLIEEIDRWVVKAVIDGLRLNHPTLSRMDLVMLPLSSQSMTDQNLLNYIQQQVKENPAHATRIGFCFDDIGLSAHLDGVRYFVSALRQYGCRFAIGDLGFSGDGIAIVKSLQADFLGIRGELVQNMLMSSVDYEVVLGLSRIARSLGMQTIAARADTQTLRDALAKMGIDYTKGEIHATPRPVAIHTEAQWI